MFWKIKFKYHIAIADAYMPMLRNKNKTKHPKLYKFADKRWRYHARKALRELNKKTDQMKQAEGL